MRTVKRTVKATLLVTLAAGVQLVTHSASAAPCAGFTDVDDTSQFCQNVEWIKNRGVTLGCFPGLYCPSDPVSRIQMAAFLNRLGSAVSPAVFSLEANPGAIDLDAGLPTNRICQTPNTPGSPAVVDIPAADYPRRALVSTTFSGLTGGALQYRTDLQFSTNSGASWDFVWLNYVNRDGAAATHWVSSSASGTLDLEADLPYRFAIVVQREAGAGTADFTNSRCFVTVSVFSRTGTSTPFDVNPTKAPDADH